MARKKSVEPKEEQEQDITIPIENVTGSEKSDVPDSDVPWDDHSDSGQDGDTSVKDGGAGPGHDKSMVANKDQSAPTDLSNDDTGSSEDALSGTGILQEDVSHEGAKQTGEKTTSLIDGEDYAALLQEVGSGTSPKEVPLSLNDEDAPASDVTGETALLPVIDEEATNSKGAASVQSSDTDLGKAGDTMSRPRPRTTAPERNSQVLTISARDHVQTEQEREEIIWHEVRNAYRTRRMLTGTLDGLERTASGKTLAVVDYKGFRVAFLCKRCCLCPMPAAFPPALSISRT